MFTPYEVIYNYVAIPDQDIEGIEHWVIEAMKQFEFYPTLEHTADIITIDNHQGKLPNDIIKLAWVAHVDCNVHCGCGESADCNCIEDDLYECTCCDDDASTSQQAVHGAGLLDRQVCRIRHQGVTYMYDYYSMLFGQHSAKYFSLMKHKSYPFQKYDPVCNECPDIYGTCSETYEISPANKIITSFEDGCVCVDYYRLPRGQRGGLLLFKQDTYLQAIAAYVMYRYHERAWNLAEEGHARKMQYYMGRWKSLKRRAIGEIGMDVMDQQAAMNEIYKSTNKLRRSVVWNGSPYYWPNKVTR